MLALLAVSSVKASCCCVTGQLCAQLFLLFWRSFEGKFGCCLNKTRQTVQPVFSLCAKLI